MKLRKLLTMSTIILFVACGEEQTAKQSVQEYKLLEINKENITLSDNYSASIRGRQDVKIIPRVGGYLTDIYITEGHKVKQGEAMFVIDQAPFLAELESAKANVAVGEAHVDNAKLIYDSKKALYSKDVISEFDLKSAQNALKMAESQLLQVKAQRTLAVNNLSYTIIKSPSNGIVGKLPYRKGDFVGSATYDGLTVVSDNSTMYVYFSMTERQVLDLIIQYKNIEQAIAQMPDIQLQLSNQSIYLHAGKVESISGIVDATTGAVSVRTAFPNPDGHLLSGASGSIILPHIQNNTIIIPQEATFEIQDKTYVYKVVDGVAVSTIVEIDKINDGKQFIVKGGLTQGDVIIAEGAGLVQEGIAVKSKK